MSNMKLLLKGGPKDGTEISVRIQDPIRDEITVAYKIKDTQQMVVAKYVKSVQRIVEKRGQTKIVYNYVNP